MCLSLAGRWWRAEWETGLSNRPTDFAFLPLKPDACFQTIGSINSFTPIENNFRFYDSEVRF